MGFAGADGLHELGEVASSAPPGSSTAQKPSRLHRRCASWGFFYELQPSSDAFLPSWLIKNSLSEVGLGPLNSLPHHSQPHEIEAPFDVVMQFCVCKGQLIIELVSYINVKIIVYEVNSM
jgi:hypothetical protein